MCYNAAYSYNRLVKEAIKLGASKEEIDKLNSIAERLKELNDEDKTINGFEHPSIAIIYKTDFIQVDFMEWGLIPNWIKDVKSAKEIQNKTINARGESIFEKPSFKTAAQKNRCVIVLSSFIEKKHTFKKHNNESLIIAGIFDEWNNKKSFSIITTEANHQTKDIHNRMPLILSEKEAITWISNETEIETIKQTISPFKDLLEILPPENQMEHQLKLL